MEAGLHFHPPRPRKLRDLQYTNSHAPSSSPSETAQHRSLRRLHLRRTYDLLHLLLQRGDVPRAARALSVLLNAYEWRTHELWRTGVLLLGMQAQAPLAHTPPSAPDRTTRIAYLRTLLRTARLRLPVLLQLVPELIAAGRPNEAAEELQLVIHTWPYKAEAALHAYLGMLTLHSAAEVALKRARAAAERSRAEWIGRALDDALSDGGDADEHEHEHVWTGVPLEALDPAALQQAARHFENAVASSRRVVARERNTVRSALLLDRHRRHREEERQSRSVSASRAGPRRSRSRSRSRSRVRGRRATEPSDDDDELSAWDSHHALDALRGTTTTEDDDDDDEGGAPGHSSETGTDRPASLSDEAELTDPHDPQSHVTSSQHTPWAASVARAFLDLVRLPPG